MDKNGYHELLESYFAQRDSFEVLLLTCGSTVSCHLTLMRRKIKCRKLRMRRRTSSIECLAFHDRLGSESSSLVGSGTFSGLVRTTNPISQRLGAFGPREVWRRLRQTLFRQTKPIISVYPQRLTASGVLAAFVKKISRQKSFYATAVRPRSCGP